MQAVIETLPQTGDMMKNQSENKIQLGTLASNIRSIFSAPVSSAVGQQMLLPNAVVGLVDIVSSSKISNSIDLLTDWEIKETFLSSAALRAQQTGMRVLNHTGDGFLFLANENGDDWAANLVMFYELLTSDFSRLVAAKKNALKGIATGLRFGVAAGPGIFGCLGGDARCMTVVGPEANLAARLCSLAAVNELVISSRAWKQMSAALNGRSVREESYDSLKGFDVTVPAVHLSIDAEVGTVGENELVAQAA
jgi:class 3 adenylate cyclase